MNLNQFKKANIGIIGCGYWATNIIKSFEEENYKNVFVFDTNPKQLNTIKSKFKYIKICKSLDELLDKDLFAALLVTPPSTHFKIGEKILNKEVNLFIEKPVTLNSNHLKKLINISIKKKCVLFSGAYEALFKPLLERPEDNLSFRRERKNLLPHNGIRRQTY